MELDTSESELRWNTVAQVIGQPVYSRVIKKVLDESSWDTVVRMTMLDSKTMEVKKTDKSMTFFNRKISLITSI